MVFNREGDRLIAVIISGPVLKNILSDDLKELLDKITANIELVESETLLQHFNYYGKDQTGQQYFHAYWINKNTYVYVKAKIMENELLITFRFFQNYGDTYKKSFEYLLEHQAKNKNYNQTIPTIIKNQDTQ